MNIAAEIIAERLAGLTGKGEPTDRDRRFADQIIIALYRKRYRVVPADAVANEAGHVHGAWRHASADGCPDDVR